MKFQLTVLLLCTLTLGYSQITKKVAFLGNSYTYENDLPNLIDQMANADGNDLVHGQSTPGGHTLNGHTTNSASLSLLTSDTWDYVVLQEQSQYPSFPHGQVMTEVYPKAKILCDSIRSANECAIPVFFNTWGRLNGDPQWDSINTFEKMNNRLYLAYNYMANVNNGIVSPVGLAFKAIYDDNMAVVSHQSLYSADGSHPSIFGSYLAACIFYNTLFNTNSMGNSYLPNGISQNEANYLQDIAANVMFMATSPIFDYTYPVAEFDYSINGALVTFNNMSEHAYDYYWEFGDNNTSAAFNPTHTYAQPDTYTVKLTASYCDRTGTYEQTIDISDLGMGDLKSELSIYPNPVSHILNIQSTELIDRVEIFNMQGEIVLEQNNVTKIDVSQIPNGVYFIKGSLQNNTFVEYFLKQ